MANTIFLLIYPFKPDVIPDYAFLNSSDALIAELAGNNARVIPEIGTNENIVEKRTPKIQGSEEDMVGKCIEGQGIIRAKMGAVKRNDAKITKSKSQLKIGKKI